MMGSRPAFTQHQAIFQFLQQTFLSRSLQVQFSLAKVFFIATNCTVDVVQSVQHLLLEMLPLYNGNLDSSDIVQEICLRLISTNKKSAIPATPELIQGLITYSAALHVASPLILIMVLLRGNQNLISQYSNPIFPIFIEYFSEEWGDSNTTSVLVSLSEAYAFFADDGQRAAIAEAMMNRFLKIEINDSKTS